MAKRQVDNGGICNKWVKHFLHFLTLCECRGAKYIVISLFWPISSFFVNQSLQVGESHVDVQRTASSNDQTGSACLKSMPNNKCIGLCILLIVLTTYTLQLASINNNSIVSFVTNNIKIRETTQSNNQNTIHNHNEYHCKTNTIEFQHNNQLENCIVF